jgi:hypothetical protein
MGVKTGSGRRRSAAEWAKVMADWERSGLDRKAFAASRGIKSGTLSWWRWRLRGGALGGPSTDALRLVKVDVAPEPGSRVAVGATRCAWELATARGVLRVHDSIGEVALDAVLAALVEKDPS